MAAAHSDPDSGKRAFTGDNTHRQRGLAGRRRGSDDLATSGYEHNDDDLWGMERVRVAVVGFGEERGAVVLTRGTAAEDIEVDYDSGGRRRCGSWRGRRIRCRRPARKMGGSEAVRTPDEAAVAMSHRG
jgi:hypothetical protein